jgi:hypothetical protein
VWQQPDESFSKGLKNDEWQHRSTKYATLLKVICQLWNNMEASQNIYLALGLM